jgi:prepilin-type N-terminal cleavage/methylation domain-containing protein
MRTRNTATQGRGFTLLETMIAILVLSIGVLGLAALLGNGLAFLNGSQADLIAQQKAAEAVECIFTARDTQTVTWAQIQNTGSGGLFLGTAQPMLDPGPDGLVDTTADSAANPSTIIYPGPDGILGTADDVIVQLSDAYNMTRTITITNIVNETSVRQIQVTINYQSGRFVRSYTLTTYISQYS